MSDETSPNGLIGASSRPKVVPPLGAPRIPRIAHLTTIDASLRYLLHAQLRSVQERGGQAIGISAPGPYVAELEKMGVRHIPLPSSTRGMRPRSDLRAAIQLWRILRTTPIDVLHTHNPKPGLYGRVLGRLAGVPIVVNTVHGLYATEQDPLPKRIGVYVLEAIASRFSDAELVQNPEDLRLLRHWRITPPRRTKLLGNGVDLERFSPGLRVVHRMQVRDELRISEDQIMVGSIGRLVAEKGFPELFEAMSLLDDKYTLVVVGPEDPDKADSLPRSLLNRAQNSGVVFLGHRPDVERIYSAMDIFVLPSHREGYPRAAMEAAASGLPVVATNIRGCRQVVEDGVNGILVPVNAPTDLADAVARLGGDTELRRQMGKESRRRAEEHFDEKEVVRIVFDNYEKVGARKGIELWRVARKPSWLQRALKRTIDVVGAGLGLVLLSPLIAGTALLIRLTMGRPVLFVQERPGLAGQPFRLFKFRTMVVRHDSNGGLLPDGDRLTLVGRLLRAASLDELPELWNVLRGDMSLVGPRPLLTQYLTLYSPEQARRHTVKPGITGWAQIHGRNALSWEERFAHDLWYVDNWTVGLDLRILARTVGATLTRKGINQPGYATADYFRGTQTEGEDEHQR